MAILASGVGSMPGTDIVETTRIVLGELPELGHLPELPDRGPTAALTGRTLGLVDELGFDLQPAGWRLTASSGVDHRRSGSLIAQDLDVAEECRTGQDGAFKIQLAGPWTLAATVERPRGDRLLSDAGARREIAQALAEAARRHCDEVRRRLTPDRLVLQVDEPVLPAVLAGAIPTASGFGRHRSVGAADAATALGWLVDAVGDSAEIVVHCCAEAVPFEVLSSIEVRAVSFDLALGGGESSYDDLGRWVDGGRAVWPGLVPAVEPVGSAPSDAELTKTLERWWSAIGYPDPQSWPETVVTPVCGLAGASPPWARRALVSCAQVVRNLSAGSGRMDA